MIKKLLFILGLLPTPAIAQTSFSQYMINIGTDDDPDKVIVRIKTEGKSQDIFIYTSEGNCMEYKVDDAFERNQEQIFMCGQTYFSLSLEDRVYIKTPFNEEKVAAFPITIDGVDIHPFGETGAYFYKPYRLVRNEKQYIF